MHLLKNFGTGGGAANLKAGGSTGAKSSYFSSLSLATEKPKEEKKEKEKVSKKTQGPPKGFIPEKFALDFDKPTIILEYRDPETNKLYHHKMALRKLRKETPTKEALDYLKKRHYHYFIPKVIDESQIEKLIEKLKNGLIGDINEELGDVDEEDFDFEYEDDFET